MATTRTVTGTIKRANGKPWYGAKVGFSTVDPTYTATATYPRSDAIVTAADGTFSIDLAAGLSTLWQCELPDGDRFTFALTESDVPVSIEQLRGVLGYPPPPDEGPTSIGLHGTVSVLTTSTQLAPANANRTSILITNSDTTKSIRLGFGTAATLTGFELTAGSDIVLSTQQSINAITASGTVSAIILEEVRS